MNPSKLSILVLTDHSNHSAENALYALLRATRLHPACATLHVATRGDTENNAFFSGQSARELLVVEVGKDFAFDPNGKAFKNNLFRVEPGSYDFIWLRLPPPLSLEFLTFLRVSFPEIRIINDPQGIYKAGSKEFLANFSELCPALKICRSLNDIEEFKSRFPIVLKPFRDYGGKGIVRIDGDQVWLGKKDLTFAAFTEKLAGQEIAYLGVEFLPEVGQGDKRIIVVDGEILGASLRLPAEGSWLCNVAAGGRSTPAVADADEVAIIRQLHPHLSKLGVVMYGIDTLVGKHGKRVLSEINTTSIGGLPQIERMTGQPLVDRAIHLIIQNVLNN